MQFLYLDDSDVIQLLNYINVSKLIIREENKAQLMIYPTNTIFINLT